MSHYKVYILPISISLIACFSFFTTTEPASAQEAETAKTTKETTGESQNSSKTDKKPVLDSDSLFGGIDFVKGMGQTKASSESKSLAKDEIEGEVIVTTNSYNYIQKPTGLIFGMVYEPAKDGKPQNQRSNQSMITGLSLLMGAMQANSKGK